MRDFTFKAYSKLLDTIINSDYNIQSYEDYILSSKDKVIILRHDIDRNPKSALKMAQREKDLDIKASYYFRLVPESFDPIVIKKVVELGHELGYHYENMSSKKGDYEEAIKDFEKNLQILRKFYPVKTICMHGSPISKWDNRNLWERYDYKNYGIIGEPYFDLDFNEIFYITDASRSWNNKKVTLRDKVESKYNYKINSLLDLIEHIAKGDLPNKIMLNVHSHNWSDNSLLWWKTYFWQIFKNSIKYFINR